MRVKINKLMDGPGPKEVLVAIRTVDGRMEQVIVDSRAIENDEIDIGSPIDKSDDRTLVELPRESMSGIWRVWVPVSETSP